MSGISAWYSGPTNSSSESLEEDSLACLWWRWGLRRNVLWAWINLQRVELAFRWTGRWADRVAVWSRGRVAWCRSVA